MRAYGRREKLTFGTNAQGWNRWRAEIETEKILQQVERGTWVPPRLEPRQDRLELAMADLGVQIDASFRVFTKRWWRAKQLGLDDDTVNDYEWRLKYLEAFFGRYRLTEITPRRHRSLPRRASRASGGDPRSCCPWPRAHRDGDRPARAHLRAPTPTRCRIRRSTR